MARVWLIAFLVCLGWLALAGYMDKQRDEMLARDLRHVPHMTANGERP